VVLRPVGRHRGVDQDPEGQHRDPSCVALGALLQKTDLESEISRLDGEISETQGQIQSATERRNEEHQSFIKEQSDFDSSIAACTRAVEILKSHYGEGGGQEGAPGKPEFMSLMQVTAELKETLQRHHHHRHRSADSVGAFLQAPNFDRYQESHAESGNIVDQVKVLAETFAEDKQSSIDEENRMLKLFNNLMGEKNELLASLTSQLGDRQSTLNTVSQDIGEKETAKANAEAEQQDLQAYLSQTKKQCEDTAALFESRQKDRAAEKVAVGEAIKVLNGPAGAPQMLLQRSTTTSRRSAIKKRSALKAQMLQRCPRCRQAAALLSKAARQLRSGVLATAAAATISSASTEGVQEVIDALQELVHRIDEDQDMEAKHKEWCESEMSDATGKKTTHEAAIEQLKQQIADETETVAEKQRQIATTNEATQSADKSFKEAETLREEERQSYQTELQNYNDALAALNQAMEILAKVYAEKEAPAPASFLQLAQHSKLIDEAAPRAVQPDTFTNVYETKGGQGVIEMIATVRKEFESGKADLEKGEQESLADYQKVEDEYKVARGDLVNQLNSATTELQTAQGNLDQFNEDLLSNEKEVQAAAHYLQQLGGSCNTLLENFDRRVKLRSEEKQAIEDAVKVLEAA